MSRKVPSHRRGNDFRNRQDQLRTNIDKWKNVPLKSVAQFINGRAFKPSEWATRGLPIVRIQNLTNSTNAYNYCNFRVEPKYVINNGQLLFAWSGTLGAFIWKGGKAVLNQHIFRVEPDSKIINKMYLYHILNYKTVSFTQKTHGTGMFHITKPKFENFEIPLPPIKTQCQIATKTESIFAEIDSAVIKMGRVAEAAPFSTLFQRMRGSTLTSIFRQVGNADNKNVGDVCWVLQSNSIKTRTEHKPSIHVGLEHIISHANELRGHGTPDDFKTSRVFLKNTVLYGRLRPELNKVWLATRDGQCSTDILPLVTNSEHVLPKFLLYALSTQKFVSYAISRSSGTKMPRVRWKEIETFQIPVPTLQEQRRAVKQIESIFSKIDAEKAKIAQLQARARTLDETVAQIKESVLHLAFSGRLLPGKFEEPKHA